MCTPAPELTNLRSETVVGIQDAVHNCLLRGTEALVRICEGGVSLSKKMVSDSLVLGPDFFSPLLGDLRTGTLSSCALHSTRSISHNLDQISHSSSEETEAQNGSETCSPECQVSM
jgi:hypothetical protein